MNCSFTFENQTITIDQNSYKITSEKSCENAYFDDIIRFLDEWFSDKPTIEVQTSGTTGTPKRILIQKERMIHSALATGKFLQLSANDRTLCCLPISFIAGKMMLVRSIVLGLKTLIVEPSAMPFKNIQECFDFTAITPMQAQLSIEKLSLFKNILIGGSKTEIDLEQKLLTIPSNIYETFASTETLSHIALRKIGNQHFETLPEITIDTTSDNCLIINAPKILEKPLKTNDIINKISDTQFNWIGRLDNVINSGGIKIFPEKIEEKLQKHINREFIIKGVRDHLLGEKVVLFIQGESYNIDCSIFDILEKYERPKEVIFVKHFPKTPTGKIQRNQVGL
ncbi:MAG: AMP-binding protein [Bacteroidota bacterium]|nr:AMP-binding protein [Bacteroidota bacterium]